MGSIILIIVIITTVWAFLKQNHHVLIFLCILSIFADNFRISIGPSLLIANVIGFFTIPIILQNKNFKIINKHFFPLWLEFFYLIVLAYIFGFLLPWDSANSDYRLWTQRAQGRSIITLFRILNELVLGYYIFWCLIRKKVNLKFIVYAIAWSTFISFVVGFIDYFTGYKIKSTLFYIAPELSNRFLGLNGEPKMFGRNSALAYGIILSYYLKINRDRKLILHIIINVIGVLLSLSASTIILFFIINIIIFLKKIHIGQFIIVSLILFLSWNILSQNTFFQTTTLYKIEKAIYGKDNKVIPNEPQLFSRFDVFDRLALVFLYENPKFAFFGTGPNLVSIPASKYVGTLPEYSTFAKRGGIDSVPNVMLNNIISRSGILGILLFSFYFINIYRFAKKDESGFSQTLFLICFVFNMVYFSIVLMFISSLIIGYISTLQSKMKLLKSHI